MTPKQKMTIKKKFSHSNNCILAKKPQDWSCLRPWHSPDTSTFFKSFARLGDTVFRYWFTSWSYNAFWRLVFRYWFTRYVVDLEAGPPTVDKSCAEVKADLVAAGEGETPRYTALYTAERAYLYLNARPRGIHSWEGISLSMLWMEV